MGMDAYIYIEKGISHGEYVYNNNDMNDATYVANSVYAEVAELAGFGKHALGDGFIRVSVPVAYFRKDYDLHQWIQDHVLNHVTDEYGGSAYLTLSDMESALEFAKNSESYDSHKRENAVKMLRRAIKSGETYFHYSAF